MDIKLKNRILIFSFVLSLLLIYKFVLTRTIEVQKDFEKLSEEKSLLDNASHKIFKLNEEEKQLDAILKKKNISVKNTFQQTLLQSITTFSAKNNLEIVSFNKPHEYKTEITKLLTYSFEVKGNYISLLKLINYLEDLQLGTLKSITFNKKKNFRTNRNYLTCQIYLQRLAN